MSAKGIPGKDTGIWSSDSNPGPDCPLCHGAGFVHPVSETGKADYSRITACRCRRESLGREKQDFLRRYSNLGSLARFTFDTLEPSGRSGYAINQQQFEAAYRAARDFAAEPEGWLIFAGPSGCGKTHLAAAIANERIKHGYPVFFITAADLLDHLRSAFNPQSELPYDSLFDQIRNTPLLVLDDLGAQSGTAWAKEKLEQLLSHRSNQRLPTVITLGVPIEQLDDRIKTRLADPGLCSIYRIEEGISPDLGWGPGLELQKKMTFASFDWERVNLPPEQRDNLERVYRLALDYAKSPDGWLILQGATGCGKTHLAAAIVNHRYQAGKPALFVVVPDFLDHLRSTFSPDSKVSYDQLFEKVKTAPFLVLDDFGEQAATPWVKEKLYQLINDRYNARRETVVTTRCSLDEIDRPISSRFIDPRLSVMFEITVPDYRGDSKPRPSPRPYNRGRRISRE